jgi:His-Xaa-Ser system protein HxsD
VRKDLAFPSDVYSLTTLKKAAYKLSHLCSFDFTQKENETVCTLVYSAPQSDEACAQIEEDFRNEVLDQDLRQIVEAETAPYRNAVLAYAFSRTGLQDSE